MWPVVGSITNGSKYERTLRSNIERRWVPDERIHVVNHIGGNFLKVEVHITVW
jgi:hypothetical protein